MKNIIIYVLPLFLFIVNSWGLYYLQDVEDGESKKKTLIYDIVVGFCSCFLIFWLVFTSYYINHPKVEVQYVEVPVEEEVIEKEKVYNTLLMNVPYILTMDSMGTDEILDDQIVVVWACVE